MSLHPFFQQLLKGQENQKPLSVPPEKLRHYIDTALAEMFAEYQWQCNEQVAIEDVLVPTTFGEVRTRFYIPQQTSKSLPLYFHLHGGGWWLGTLDSLDEFLSKLACSVPCVVASVEYSLSPEATFPQAPEEVYQVVKHLQHDFPIDINCQPMNAGIGGNSAGGNLTAALCLMARDRGGISISCQWLDCPATDASCSLPSYSRNAEGYMLTRQSMEQAWQWYLKEQASDEVYASTLNGQLSDLPPALVFTAEYDPLCDDGRLYAQKMLRHGVDVRHLHYEGMVHGFMGYSHLDQSWHAYRQLINFLRVSLFS